MLRAVFHRTNQAWSIMGSDNNLIGIGPMNQTLFESRKELLGVLRKCGLMLNGNTVALAA